MTEYSSFTRAIETRLSTDPDFVTAIFGNPLELGFELVEGSAVLSWPSDLQRVGLESSGELSQWSPVDSPPVEIAGRMVVVEPVGTRRFYRLRVQ